MDRVALRGLQAPGRTQGVLPQEREEGQTFVVDLVWAWTPGRPRPRTT